MRTSFGCAAMAAGLLLAGGVAWAQDQAPAAPTAVLDTHSFFRCRVASASERVRLAEGRVVPLLAAFKPGWQGTFSKYDELIEAPTSNTPLPAELWRAADFDDAAWPRLIGPIPPGSRDLALLCLRGKFQVDDPKQAGELKLELRFRGGAAVYVNGTEVARANLPAGKIEPLTLAEAYPTEAYVDPDGFVLRQGFEDPGKYKDRFALRSRSLTATVPASLLRRGVNVLAVEIHRAPTDEVLLMGKPREYSKGYCWWAMMSLEGLSLTAAGGGIVPNTARPAGVRVFTQPAVQSVHSPDYGDPCEPLRAVQIIAARNGAHSGQAVLSTTRPLSGLKVVVSDLKPAGGGKAIPAAAVEVRHAVPGGSPDTQASGRYGRGTTRLEGLLDGVPATVDVPEGSGGVTLPIWLTVHVPAGAAAGQYAGSATISAAGFDGLLAVPIQVKVHDWALPDPPGLEPHVGIVQSPWSLALKYDVPLWSAEHWALIDQSFKLLGEAGTDVLFLPLLRQTHFGNEHSMVTWIKQPGGSFQHDFSLVQKYVDVAAKHLGKIRVVGLYLWEPYTGSSYLGHPERDGKGMLYSLRGPDGTLVEAEGPKWSDPAVRDFWKPVVDGIREILARHGLADSMMFGVAGDSRPTKSAVEALQAIAPKVPWIVHSHATAANLHGQPVGYLADVWGAPVAPDPSEKRLYGWRLPQLRVTFPREGSNTVGPIRTNMPPARYRLALEGMLAAGIHGFGRVGADFWDLVPGMYNRNWPILGRYPISGWAQLNLMNSTAYVLWPGPDGPVATTRFEMIREGAQEAQAKIFLERLLTGEASRAKLGDDLAARCQQVLDDRVRALAHTRNDALPNWILYLGPGFTERADALYAVAAEAAAKS